MLELWLQLPDIFVVDVVCLLLGPHSIPEEEVSHFVVVIAHILISPDLIERVSSDIKSPDIFAMLDAQILRQFGIGGEHLINKSDLLSGL